MDPIQFTYTLLTRSQRVSHENLRLRDPAWLAELEKTLAEAAFGRAPAGCGTQPAAQALSCVAGA